MTKFFTQIQQTALPNKSKPISIKKSKESFNVQLSRNSMPVKYNSSVEDDSGLRQHEKDEIKRVQTIIQNIKNQLVRIPEIVECKIQMLESVMQFICEIRDTFDNY